MSLAAELEIRDPQTSPVDCCGSQGLVLAIRIPPDMAIEPRTRAPRQGSKSEDVQEGQTIVRMTILANHICKLCSKMFNS